MNSYTLSKTNRKDGYLFSEVNLASDPFTRAILAILNQAKATRIIRYKKAVGRGRVFWAYYVTANQIQEQHIQVIKGCVALSR